MELCPSQSNIASYFKQSVNPYLMGQRLDNVVAKKSVPNFSEEDEDETSTSAAAASKSTT